MLMVLMATYVVFYFVDRRAAAKFLSLLIVTMMFPVVTFGVGILTCIVHARTFSIEMWNMKAWIAGCVFAGLPLSTALSIYFSRRSD